jgi:nucleoid-associated protein EbfC
MLKGLGDLGNLMKMQKEMKNIQKKLKKSSAEGGTADDSVKAVVNGEYELLDIKLDPDFVKNNEVKKIEKNILFAVNDAVERMKDQSAKEMAKLTGGMDLSGLMK